MVFEGFTESSSEPFLLVASSLAAAQWELRQMRAEAMTSVVRTPQIGTPNQYLRHVMTQRSSSEQVLLTRRQATAIWRRIIALDRSDGWLASPRSTAVWAHDAWDRLLGWELSWQRQAVGNDNVSLQRWCREYTAVLEREGWTDTGLALQDANRKKIDWQPWLSLIDMPALPPALRRHFDACRAGGGRVETLSLPHGRCKPSIAPLPDRDAELEQAAAWCEQSLRTAPSSLLCVVVPGGSRNRAPIHEAFSDVVRAGHQLAFVEGERLSANALCAGSIDAIKLLSPVGDFGTLSRWLRAPDFHGADIERWQRCARLEAELRSMPLSQLGFADAYRHSDLVSRVQAVAPEAANDLERALRSLEEQPRTAIAADWVETWERALRLLGTRPGTVSESPQLAWDRALAEFASLSAMLGPLDMAGAIREFETLLRSTREATPLTASGVHILDDSAQVGRCYDGCWIMGLTDQWPGPPELNPLLPRRLQVEQAMPGATPSLVHKEAIACVDRIRGIVGELVISYPLVTGDSRNGPSSVLASLSCERWSRIKNRPARGYAQRQSELVADPVPQWPRAAIPGGARTLETQLRSPFRAFVESRVGAREIPSPARGLGPRLRGVAAHQALERLYRPVRGAQDAIDFSALRNRRFGVVDGILIEVLPWSFGPWPAIRGLERSLLERMLSGLITVDEQRPAFVVVELEQKHQVRLENHTVACRIDRVDQDPDGRRIVIDFKTGSRSSPAGWFQEPPASAQLPIYALTQGPALGGLLLAELGADPVVLRGAADVELPPARLTRLPEGRTWAQQIEHWREQMTNVALKFCAGGQLDVTDDEGAAGSFAPLSRIFDRSHRTVKGAEQDVRQRDGGP